MRQLSRQPAGPPISERPGVTKIPRPRHAEELCFNFQVLRRAVRGRRTLWKETLVLRGRGSSKSKGKAKMQGNEMQAPGKAPTGIMC
ncbi:hypothetical protein TMatcc_002806 [Talaromyces marneffei ATCC 18224]